MKSSRLFDPQVDRFVDTLYLVLLDNREKSYLPELYSIFGEELLQKFLNIFSGVTIEVPTRDGILKSIRDVKIYLEIMDLKESGHAFEIVSSKYGISESSARRIYKRLSKLIETCNIIVRRDS